MPRHADLSPNIFLASPSDGSACVSQVSPEGNFWCTFFFYFVEGGGCIIEVVADVRRGITRILRRGPSIKVDEGDASELRRWRGERLKADGLKYMQMDPVLVKKALDNLTESCGQTLIDKEIWGQSWNCLGLCIYTLQFRHPDLVDEIRSLDLTRGTSSLSAKEMAVGLRSICSSDSLSQQSSTPVALIGGAGVPGRARLRGTRVLGATFSYSASSEQQSRLSTSVSLRRTTSNSFAQESGIFSFPSFDQGSRSLRSVPCLRTFARDVQSPLPTRAALSSSQGSPCSPREEQRAVLAAHKIAEMSPFNSMCNASGQAALPDAVTLQRMCAHEAWLKELAGDDDGWDLLSFAADSVLTDQGPALMKALSESITRGALSKGSRWLEDLSRGRARRNEDWSCSYMQHIRLPPSMSNGSVPFHARIPTGFSFTSAPISRA